MSMLIGIMIFSCSSNDDENGERLLARTLQESYDQGALSEHITFTYENNVYTSTTFYNSSNELTYSSKWFYNTEGLLSGIKSYLPNGELDHESTISYDTFDRIIRHQVTEEKGTYTTTSNFTYNSDNTISVITDANGNVSSKTYYTNTSGIIFKEVGDRYSVEVTYDSDNNPTQKISTLGTTSYTYENTVLKQGVVLTLWRNVFGGEINNPVLWGNSLDDYADSYGNKYVIREESPSGSNRYEYVFDSEGYPTQMNSFYNNTLTSKLKYIYE